MSDQTTSRTGGQLVAECGAYGEIVEKREEFAPKTTLSAIREASLRRGHS